MTEDFDYTAFLEKRRKDMLDRFRDPAFEGLASAYSANVPSSLLHLHALGDSLIKTPLSIQLEGGTLDIQCFVPITTETVAVGERYNWQYFEFAVGSNNEYLLAPIRGIQLLCVDHEGNGTDVEETAIDLEKLFTRIEEVLQK